MSARVPPARDGSGADAGSAPRPTSGSEAGFALELRGITKRFGPVVANRDIDLVVRRGSIHGIVGENGAGKSTLMSILYGFYRADEGEILVNGQRVDITSSAECHREGDRHGPISTSCWWTRSACSRTSCWVRRSTR